MSELPETPDLQAIAMEADAELQEAEGVGLTELGYYEAELTSLRDAATTLAEAERPTQ